MGTEKHRMHHLHDAFCECHGGYEPGERKDSPWSSRAAIWKNLELFLEKEMDSFSGLKLDDFDISVPVTVACGSDDRNGNVSSFGASGGRSKRLEVSDSSGIP